MDETITSIFDYNYYFKAICVGVLFSLFVLFLITAALFTATPQSLGLAMAALMFSGVLYIFYYFFSKSWKRVTVTLTEITVYDVVFKTQLIIPFTDITRVGVYRPRPGRFGAVGQDFVIEYTNNQDVRFSKAWYENYNKLTMAIYYHKYGAGHGRERYLARHGR